MRQSPLKELSIVDPNSREGRLLHLYSVIEETPSYKIDISVWRCGTYACIGGWAAMDPVFMEQGLFFEPVGNEEEICCGEYIGIYALMNFFKLKSGEARDLFSYNRYPAWDTVGEPAKKLALERIGKLLK